MEDGSVVDGRRLERRFGFQRRRGPWLVLLLSWFEDLRLRGWRRKRRRKGRKAWSRSIPTDLRAASTLDSDLQRKPKGFRVLLLVELDPKCFLEGVEEVVRVLESGRGGDGRTRPLWLRRNRVGLKVGRRVEGWERKRWARGWS